MSKQDLLKIQTCILKVNIHCHCDGCQQKVKKLLQKIDGVYSVSVDAEQGKVLVAGDVDPAKLIIKLKRAGKHAEIWGGQKGVNQNYPINQQFRNMQVDNGKGGKDNKSPNEKGQKGGGGQLAHIQNIKGAQAPIKEHKAVKFKIPEEEFDVSDEGFDEYDDDEEEEEEEGYGHGHPMHNKTIPGMGNGRGPLGPVSMMNGPANNKGNGVGGGNYVSDKKGDVIIDLPVQTKGKGGNYSEAKNGNKGGKKSNGGNIKGEKQEGGGEGDFYKKKKNAKSDGGLLGRFLGLGKNSKGGAADSNNNSWGGNIKGKEGKLDGTSNNKSKDDIVLHDFDIPRHHKNGKSGEGINGNGNGNGNGNVGEMGPMNQKGPTRNIPAVQGLPGGGDGGYYQGMQMQPTPYNMQQQQQNMQAMMMNQQQQQQANMNMYPPAMMYGGPHPSMNYMPPPPMPSHPMADPITHVFSDENTQSYCSIM